MYIYEATTVKFGKKLYHMHDEMMAWCKTNVGEGSWHQYNWHFKQWAIECNFGNTTFYFAKPCDATAFKLRFLCI